MKQQPYSPNTIKVGAQLHQVTAFEFENKIYVDIDTWVVRSIKRKRGTGVFAKMNARNGIDVPVYVNLTKKINGVTHGKHRVYIKSKKLLGGHKREERFGWFPSISDKYKKRFAVGDDLPVGIYTTVLSALLFALWIEKRHMKSDNKRLQELKDLNDQKLIDELKSDIIESQKIIKSLKSKITKHRNHCR